jgi:hypothetical protein
MSEKGSGGGRGAEVVVPLGHAHELRFSGKLNAFIAAAAAETQGTKEQMDGILDRLLLETERFREAIALLEQAPSIETSIKIYQGIRELLVDLSGLSVLDLAELLRPDITACRQRIFELLLKPYGKKGNEEARKTLGKLVADEKSQLLQDDMLAELVFSVLKSGVEIWNVMSLIDFVEKGSRRDDICVAAVERMIDAGPPFPAHSIFNMQQIVKLKITDSAKKLKLVKKAKEKRISL